ncbi:MAG: phytanoyl-CoA dioxygenase family protein [Planctomycetes bacterium]|nr:phytanoyl-CoA dioxygenase family protein [Planctomycetota bacterium]
MNAVLEVKPTVTVTQAQIDFFHTNGFLALDAITTRADVERLQSTYDRIFAQKAGREEGNQFDLGGSDEDGKQEGLPQILNPMKYAPELADMLARVNARAVAQQLLGEGCMDRGSHAILKPAGHGVPTPWHQDEAYWGPDLVYRSLSVWIPLQDATVENGCLWFVPGSHKLEVLPHRCIGGDTRIHGLELVDAERHTRNAVACPIPAGGATFHLNGTLHYAGPNRTNQPRRALILGFGLDAKKRETPRRFPWNEVKAAPRQERAKQFQEKAKQAQAPAK